MQKVFDQNKQLLYYALVLPDMGKDKPPLPVTEMITNSHSIPSISHWLMEFKRELSYTTKRRIKQVKTDYSWALINSVLLSFNKENISVYLTRALKWCLDKLNRGTQEYATFRFAFLLNCTSMQVALGVFYHMCVLFDAEEYTHLVQQSKIYLDKCVLKTQDMELEESDIQWERRKAPVRNQITMLLESHHLHMHFKSDGIKWRLRR